MTGQNLFTELLLRLRTYSDAAVLWIFLKEHADEREFKTTAVKMAMDQLTETVKRWDVQRSIERLQEAGLIRVRTHANTATLVTVKRDAVLDLLRRPVADRLPGRSKKHFPFLEAWSADVEAAKASDPTAALDANVTPDGVALEHTGPLH